MVTNTLLTISMITQMAARTLVNSLGFSKHVNRNYDSYFAKKGAVIGATLNMRKPSRYVVTPGAALTIQDTTEQQVSITLNQFHVGASFTSIDKTLSLTDYNDTVLVPAMASLANKIDFDGMALGLQCANVVGTPGSPPTSADAVLAATERLDYLAAPDDGTRTFVMSPTANRKIIGGLANLFNDQGELSKQYKTSRMQSGLGYNWAMDQNVPTVTVGTGPGGSPVVNTSTGITSGSASITVTGGSGSVTNAWLAGESVTIAGVYAVNPMNQSSTGQLANFVILSNATTVSGNVTLTVAPTPVTSGAFQNITIVSAGASKAVTNLTGTTAGNTYKNSLAFHKDAFVLATADLVKPAGNVQSSTVVRDGISIRAVEAYDPINDRAILRFDVLYGWAILFNELCVRVTD